MKLNAPKQVTWIIAVILVVLAIVVKFSSLASLTVGFWLAVASAVILAAGSFFSGL